MAVLSEITPKVGIGPYLVTNIIANGNNLLMTGPGVLHILTINTKGATANLIKIYDGIDATGTLLATIDTTVSNGSFHYDLGYLLGLFIVTSAGTCADITVTYRT